MCAMIPSMVGRMKIARIVIALLLWIEVANVAFHWAYVQRNEVQHLPHSWEVEWGQFRIETDAEQQYLIWQDMHRISTLQSISEARSWDVRGFLAGR